MPTRMSTRTLLPVLLCVAAASASAGSLKLRDGSVVRMDLSQQQLVMPGLGQSAVIDSASLGMRYYVVEPDGSTWAGMVPGSQGVAFGDASIAQSPITGDVFAVFSRYAPDGAEVVFTSWTGQTFTESQVLATSPGDDVAPVLTFSEAGDAVLAWEHVGLLTSVYVRHLELAPAGPIALHSFSDLGSPASLVRPAGGSVGMRPGVSHVLDDSDHRAAYIFVANEDRDQMGLVRLNLDALIQGGGFNAPPVPVSLSASVPQSVGSPAGSLGDRAGDVGSLLAPWRLVMGQGLTAYYWTESDRLALVVFRNEVGGRLVSVPLPASAELIHATAFQAAMREVGRVDRRPAERLPVRRR